jgi:hypothetical protein
MSVIVKINKRCPCGSMNRVIKNARFPQYCKNCLSEAAED